MTEKIRAFIAIDISEEMRRSLEDLITSLKSAGPQRVRWTDPRNMHLTLKFLGNIPADQTDRILQALSDQVGGVGPVNIALGNTGAFPSMNAPRVIWVGLAGELDTLSVLQKKVEDVLEHLGYPRENRPFKPHLTLGRLNDRSTREERETTAKALASSSGPSKASMKADKISLIRSTLTPGGPIYNKLGNIPV